MAISDEPKRGSEAPEIESREFPRLPRLALQRRLDALFRALSSDFLLREQFVTDPAQITSEYVYGRRMSANAAATLNYFIYSCLADNYLISWFREYSLRNNRKPITRGRFLQDFSHAVVQHRAHRVVFVLSRLALGSAARLRLDDDWLQIVFGRWLGSDDGTGTDATGTGTDATGTGTDATGTGTDATGTGTDATGTGTDATGTGTDATGTGTSQTLTAITWQTYITQQTQSTTESTTPFTHTGITRSPFTTHQTQTADQFTDRFLGTSYVIVTLEALTDYARQLIRTGALESILNE